MLLRPGHKNVSKFSTRTAPQRRAATRQSRVARFRKRFRNFSLSAWSSNRIVRSICDVFRHSAESVRAVYGATGYQYVGIGYSSQLALEELEQRHMLSAVSLVSSYSQDFDALAITGTTNATLPVGWEISEAGGGSRDNEQYAADDGGSATGDMYSYGVDASTERALGGLQSNSLVPTFGASFQNNSGQTITELTVAFTGEQWRLGASGRLDRLDFQYSLDATSLTTGTWVDADALDFVGPTTAGSVGELDGNAAANRTDLSATLTGLNIPDGATFYIRWTDFNPSGSDDGLAVDDLAVVAGPVSTTYVNNAWFGFANGQVIADADSTTPDNQGAIYGTNAFAAIQDAIDAVEAGGTVSVADGSYVGNVLINKSITLVSQNGRDVTTIQGVSSVGALGAVQIAHNVNGVIIGGVGQGFTIVGIDNGIPGIENAAVYFQGNHNGASVIGNDIQANGDAGLTTEFSATNTGFVIDGNIFSGQTFVGSNPAGSGFGAQFTLANVPRQLVVIGGGTGGGNTSNITFTNNQITGTAGGISLTDDLGAPEAPHEQGNTLVTIDSVGATITGNTFAGTTNRFGSALRARGTNTVISGNDLDGSGMGAQTNYLFLANPGTNNDLSTDPLGLGDVLGANSFDPLAVIVPAISTNTVFIAAGGIQAVIDAAAPGTVLRFSGNATEDVDVNKAVTLGGDFDLDGTLTLSAAGATLDAGFSPGIVTSGSLALTSGSILTAEVNGATPGTGHDQYVVNGTVSLGGATLNALGTISATVGDTIVLIDNDAADAVSGTFAGLSQGSTVTIAGQEFAVFYNGGDGNDVVLVAAPASPPSVVYVDDGWTGTIAGDDPDNGGPANIYGYDAFDNITDALAAVASGGSIVVSAGSYSESFTIGKDVSISGAGDSLVVIDAGGAFTGITVSNGFDVSISGVSLANFASTGIRAQGDLDLADSTVSGGFVGVWVDGGTLDMSSSVVEGSQIFGVQVAGVTTIQNSEIDVDGSSAASVVVSDANALITGSKLTGGQRGLLVNAVGSATVHGSDLSANSLRSVENATATAVDASGNWWGTTSEAGVQSETLGLVDFTPYLNSDESLENQGVRGFSADNSYLHVTALGQQVGGGRIKEGVGLIDDGLLTGDSRLVDVHTGNYVEDSQIFIDKSLMISGDSMAKPVITPGQNFIGGNAGDAWLLVDENVTFNLDNVEFDGNNFFVWQAVRSHGNTTIDSVDFSDIKGSASGGPYRGVAVQSFGGTVGGGAGFDSHGGGGSASHLVVENSTFQDIGRIGVLVKGDGATADIGGNVYTGKGAVDGLDYAVEAGSGAKIDIVDNTVSGNLGVAGDGSTSAGVLITTYFGAGTEAHLSGANNFSNNTDGVHVGYGTTDSSVVTITGGTFSGNDAGGVHVGGTADVEIHGATITNNDTGVTAIDGAVFLVDSDTELSGNQTGILVASGATGNITGNLASIHGNDIGIDVDGGAATISGNHIYDNTTGIRFTNGGTGSVTSNDFEGDADPDNGTDIRYTLSAGAVADPLMGNTFAGTTYIDNQSPHDITALRTPAGTNAYNIGGVPTTNDFDIEGRVYHEIDDSNSGLVTWVANTIFVASVGVTATVPSASDNDYTRIKNAIEAAADGDTIQLLGTFDWTETNAAASWAVGNDDNVLTTADNYSILVPVGLDNVTFTAASGLGSATILGPQDLATVNLEGVLIFDGGDNQGWTISDLRFLDFDLSIGFFNGAGGVDAFNNTTITNNYIRVPADLNVTAAPADANQNIGIHYSFGTNQTISSNVIELVGNGVSDGTTNFSSSVGMQSNTSGDAVYDGLLIDNNTINVTGTLDSQQAVFLGIWENAHGHTSTITVSNNAFFNLTGNNAATNLMRAFRVTSHSGSGPTLVSYNDNTVSGANIGFQWLAGADFAGNQPVQLTNNTLTDIETGYLVQSNGLATISGGSVTGASGTGVDIVAGSSATVSGGSFQNLDQAIRVAGEASISGVDFNAGTDNDIDIQLLAGAGTVTLGAGNLFGGDDYFIDNASANNLDLAALGYNDTNYEGLDPGTLADAFTIEDLLRHKVDVGNTSAGLIRVVAGELFVTTTGTGLSDETIQNAVDAATAGDTVNVESGTFSENVVVDKDIKIVGDTSGGTILTTSLANSRLITISAAGTFGTLDDLVDISNLNLDGATLASQGVYIEGNADLGTFSLSDGDVKNFRLHGTYVDAAAYSGDPSLSALVQNVNLTDLDFTNNGITGGGGTADIQFFGFNNNASLTNITAVGNRIQNPTDSLSTGARGSIHFRGVGNSAGVGVQSMGTVSFDNVDVTGKYRNQFIGIQRYSDVDNLSFTDVELGDATSELTGTFGALLRFDGVGNGSLAAPETVDLGDTYFHGLVSTSNVKMDLEFAPDNVFAFLKPDATDTRWDTTTGAGVDVAADFLTLDQAYEAEDRILHYVDNLDFLTGGQPFKGWAEIQDGQAFVTSAFGSINRAVEVVDSSGTVHVASGVYTQNVDTSANAVTLSLGSSPGQVTVNGNATLDANDALLMEINGLTAGTQHDQLVVNGTVTLGGATLSTAGSSINATQGDTLTLIDNDSTDSVSGTFASISNGDVILVNAEPFFVFYAGDTGNDVVLSRSPDGTPPGPQPAPSVVFVDDDWSIHGDGVDADGAGGASLGNGIAVGYDQFDTIQEAIDAVALGGTIYVYAGTYAENLLVNKSVTLSGEQAVGDADTRFAAFTTGIDGPKADDSVEAIITAPVNNPTSGNPGANDLIRVTADNVTIDGFVIDGNNPLLGASATTIDGVNIHARRGITNIDSGDGFNPLDNLLVQNNIMQNFGQRAISLANNGPVSTGNLITENVIRSFAGQGVILFTNAYADITDNTIDVPEDAIGLHLQNFFADGSMTWSGNSITVGQDAFGIHANLFYAPAATLDISGNTVNAAAGVTGASDFTWGINVWSVQVGSTVNVTNNTVGSAGGEFARGINLWNLPTTDTVTVSGGSIGNSVVGINLDNIDPFFAGGANTTVDITNVSISSGDVGIRVRADVLPVAPFYGTNTVAGSVAANIEGVTITGATTGILVQAPGSSSPHAASVEVSNDTEIIGANTAIQISGSQASGDIHDNDDSISGNVYGIDVDGGSATITGNSIFDNTTGIRFTNGGSGSVESNDFDGGLGDDNGTDLLLTSTAGLVTSLEDNAFAGDTFFIDNQGTQNLDVTAGTGNTFDESNNFRIEDKMHHRLDTDLAVTTGLVTWVAGNVYVTDAGTDHSIQRGVNAASADDTVNIEDGTYVGQVEVDKNLTLRGQSQAGVILQTPAALTLDNSFIYGGLTRQSVLAITAGNVTVEDLTVDGAGAGGTVVSGNDFHGIGIHNADATIDSVTVTGVRDNPLNGVQRGRAIFAGNDTGTHTVTVMNSAIADYQKNGIDMRGAGLTANITDNTITGAGDTMLIAQNGIVLLGGVNGTISGNTISDHMYSGVLGGPDPINDTQSTGILLFDAGNVTIDQNTIDANDIGIYSWGGNIGITNNDLGLATANRYEGIVVDEGSSTVSGNEINGGNIGIAVIAFSGGAGDSAATITSNTVTGTGVGVYVVDDDDMDGAQALAKLQVNTLVGSGVGANGVGIRVAGGAVVDAGSNVGDADPTGLGSSTGLNILTGYTGTGGNYAIEDLNLAAQSDVYARFNDFGPYVDISIIEDYVFDDTDDATRSEVIFAGALNSVAPTTPVFVDDSWAGTALGVDADGAGGASLGNGTAFGVDQFATIEDALAAVAATGQVLVYNGTYFTSGYIVDKSVTIEGESRGGVIVAPADEDSHEDNSFSGVSVQQAFIVSDDNVTIRTLTIDGDANLSLSGNNNFRSGIITPDDGNDRSNLLFTDLDVKNIYRRGIQVSWAGNNNEISNSLIEQDGGSLSAGGAAIGVFGGNAGATVATRILDNDIINVSESGVVSNFGALLDIRGNEITNTPLGMNLAALEDGSTIGGSGLGDGNIIDMTGLGSDDIGVLVTFTGDSPFNPGTVTIAGNAFTGSGGDAGVWSFRTGSDPLRIVGNTFTSSASTSASAGEGAAIFITDDDELLGESSTDNNANVEIQGNTISGFHFGVHVRAVDDEGTAETLNVLIGGPSVADNNDITGSGGAGSAGVFVEDNANASSADVTIQNNNMSISGFAIGIDVVGGSATITGNSIHDNDIGVRVNDGDAMLTNNDIHDNDHGVWIEGTSTLNMTGGTVDDNTYNGLFVTGDGTVQSVTVDGTSFSGNASGQTNVGDIVLFDFSAPVATPSTASFTNVTVTSNNSDFGIQVRGTAGTIVGPLDGSTTAEVSYDNVQILGTQQDQALLIQQYADLSGFSFNDVVFNSVADGGLVLFDTDGTLDLGNTTFHDTYTAGDGTADGTGFDIATSLTNIDATDVTFVGADKSTLAGNFAIEDRVGHYIDADVPGPLVAGFVDWIDDSVVSPYAEAVFVTQESYAPLALTTTPSIQRGIDASLAGYNVYVQGGAFTYTENLTISKDLNLIGEAGNTPNLQPAAGGDLISINGAAFGDDETVTIDNFNFNGLSGLSDYGIHVLSTADFEKLIVSNSTFTGFDFDAIEVLGNSVTGLSVKDVELTDLSFSNNGLSGGGGTGDIQFFVYNGDATLTNLTLIGSATTSFGARLGIQFRGTGDAAGIGTQPMGNVTLDNVDVSGKYRTQMIGIQRYSDVDNLSLNNLALGGLGSEITGMFGASLRFDAVGSGSLAVPATVDLGNTLFRGLDGTSVQRHEIEFAPDNNHTFLRADGTGTTWVVGGVPTAAASLTLPQAFAVEDRILHYVDKLNPTHGLTFGPYKGFVDIQADTAFITDSPDAGVVGDGSLQRGINIVSVGGTVHVEAGTYVDDTQILVNKDVTIIGDDDSTTIFTKSFNTAGSGDGRGWWLVDAGVTLDLSSVGFDGTGFLTYQAIRHKGDGGIIDNVAFSEIKYQESGPAYSGVGVAFFPTLGGNLDFTNSTFSEIGRIGVLYFGAGVTGTFADNVYTGKGAGDWLDYAVEVGAGAVVDIENNNISRNLGVASVDSSTSAGVLVTTFFGPGSEAHLSGNTIDGNTTGVAVGFDNTDTSVVTISGDTITNNTDSGVSVVGGSITVQNDTTLTGNGTGIIVGDGGEATIIGNDDSITGNTIGIDVDGGTARVQDNDLNGNTIGVRIQNGGIADLGQIGVGTDFTGLGVSTGGNDFSGYTAAATATGGAIVNLNTGGAYSNAGPQGLAGPEFDVTAFNNIWDDNSSAGIENVVWHDADDSAVGFVDYAALANLVVSLDPLPSVVDHEDIDEGGFVTVYGQFTNDAQAHTVTIDWGDGSPDTVVPLAAGVITFAIASPAGVTYTDDPDGPTQSILRNIAVTVEEDANPGNFLADTSLSIDVNNVIPSADLSTLDNDVNEGEVFSVDIAPVVDPGADTVVSYRVNWGDGHFDVFVGDLSAGASHNHAYEDGLANPNVTVTIDLVDDDGTWNAVDSLNILVHNVDPTAGGFFAFDAVVDEGDTTTVFFTGPFTDPGNPDTPFHFAYDFNGNGIYGEAGELGNGTYSGSGAASMATVPATFLADDSDSPRTVRARIIDNDGGFTEYSVMIAINNVDPVVDAGADATAFAGVPFNQMVSFTDPGADANWTVNVDWNGDGDFFDANEAAFGVGSHTFNINHTYGLADIGNVYTVTVQVDDNDGGVDTDTFTVMVEEDTFRVLDIEYFASGFDVTFNRAVGLADLNLYDGNDASVDLADLTVVGDTLGTINGSITWNASTNTLSWVKTSGVLAADDYTITLESDALAFQDTLGNVLDGDGDFDDSEVNDDYVDTFSVAASADRVVSLPDFARGAGQDVNLPATGVDIPISIDQAASVTAVDVDVVYDPALLNITGATLGSGPLGAGGWSITTNAVSPGVLKITISGTTALSGANVQLIRLNADVPNSAPYADSQIIRLTNLEVNEGAIGAKADYAVHKAAYLGDADGNGIYTGFDASLISRVVVLLDTGFDAHDWTDPVVVADATSNGALSGQDASLVAQEAALIDTPEIPPLPMIGPLVAGTPGIDPELSVPDIFAAPGDEVTIPVTIEVFPAEEDGVFSATFDVFYNNTQLTISTADIEQAMFWDDADGWSLTKNVPGLGGQARLVFFNSTPSDVGTGDIAYLTFTVDSGLMPGDVVNLNIQPVDPNEGGLTWTDVDGSIAVTFTADFEPDGDVDGDDLTIWQGGYGTGPNATVQDGDADRDGDVDGRDFLAWQRQYGSSLSPIVANVTASPEPQFSVEAEVEAVVDAPIAIVSVEHSQSVEIGEASVQNAWIVLPSVMNQTASINAGLTDEISLLDSAFARMDTDGLDGRPAIAVNELFSEIDDLIFQSDDDSEQEFEIVFESHGLGEDWRGL